jgi:hypothetical protein
VGPRAILDAVVERKIPSPRRESNPRTPIFQQQYNKQEKENHYLIKLCLVSNHYGDISGKLNLKALVISA